MDYRLKYISERIVVAIEKIGKEINLTKTETKLTVSYLNDVIRIFDLEQSNVDANGDPQPDLNIEFEISTKVMFKILNVIIENM